MPDEKRSGWAAGGRSPFGELLDEIIGSGAQRVFETVHRVTPKCGFCGTSTIMRCQQCGRNVCNVHGFVNARAWNRYTVICSECVSAHFGFVEIEPPPNYARPDEMPWQHEEQPWDILGIRWDADEVTLNKAFKAQARKVHPDHASDDIDRARRERAMSRVTEAYEWMKQRLGRR
jgi:hypothetical protein